MSRPELMKKETVQRANSADWPTLLKDNARGGGQAQRAVHAPERALWQYRAGGYVWCPHSATAAEAWSRLSDAARSERPWIVAATAHPYKFADVVEPLIGRAIEPTPALAAILDRPTRKVRIRAELGALADTLRERAVAA